MMIFFIIGKIISPFLLEVQYYSYMEILLIMIYTLIFPQITYYLTCVQVSNAYLQLVQGSGFKMLLDFTKEMPKQATRLTFDFSAVVGPLFFEWVVVLLFPV